MEIYNIMAGAVKSFSQADEALALSAHTQYTFGLLSSKDTYPPEIASDYPS
jgi:hypothetical protein